MGDVIRKYGDHPEFKSLGPNNLICAKETIGLLRRRTVIAKPIFKFIGKEVDRGTSEDAYVMEGETACAVSECGNCLLSKSAQRLV